MKPGIYDAWVLLPDGKQATIKVELFSNGVWGIVVPPDAKSATEIKAMPKPRARQGRKGKK